MWHMWLQLFSKVYLSKTCYYSSWRKKPFKCAICDHGFCQKGGLNKLVSAVHKGEKLFKCVICDHSFSQKGDMNIHFASVHEGKKPFKCDICDYSCFLKKTMNTHIASVHEELKPFKCQMNRHVMSVHERKKSFKCYFCNHYSSLKHQMEKHVAKKHSLWYKSYLGKNKFNQLTKERILSSTLIWSMKAKTYTCGHHSVLNLDYYWIDDFSQDQ